MGGNLVSKDDAPILTPDATVDQYDATIVGTLAWNKAQIGTDRKEIKILPGTYKLLTSLILPENIYLDLDNGALIKPAAGVSLTVYSPEHIIAGKSQKIIDITGNSTNPLMFTNAGTFPVNWWGVDDEAAQMAITEFGRVPGCHMEFVGAHAWNSGVKLTYANDCDVVSKVSGWGSTITSTVNGSYCLEFETGLFDINALVVEGLEISGCGNESGGILFDADSNCTNYFFNVTVKGIHINEFGGNGIEIEGCFFESRIYDCDLRAHSTNTTGYCIYANGVTQQQSSVSIYECTTRGGYYGIYVNTTREVYINGGTYILAQHEGIYCGAGRNTVINAHCEDNCVAGTTGEAGMAMGGSGTIIGFRTQADTEQQLYGLYLSPSAQSATTTGVITVVGGEWDPVVAGGNNTVAFIKCNGVAGSSLVLDGNQTVLQVNGNTSITRNFSKTIIVDVSTATTAAKTLQSYTVPRYELPWRSSMKVTAHGSITEVSSGTKLIKLYIGDDGIEVHPAHNSGTSKWKLEALLSVTTATVIDVFWTFYDSDAAATAVVTQGHTAVTQDISAEFDIYLQGTTSDSDDDITQSNMIIDYV